MMHGGMVLLMTQHTVVSECSLQLRLHSCVRIVQHCELVWAFCMQNVTLITWRYDCLML